MRRRPRPIVWPRSYGDSGIKASATGPLIATHVAHTPQYTPRRYDRLADEGFTKNVIAYQCVQLRADAVASLRWLIFKGDKEVADHEIKRLLKRQNPMTYGPRWWRELAAFHSIAGNAYVEAVGPRPTEPPLELWNLRPDRMKVIPGDDGMPEAYRYEVNGQTRDFPVNLVAGAMQLLHIKEFHPLNDWYGMSPVEAAARYIDMDNAASDHNLARLQNGANPSGLVVFKEKLLPDQAKAAEEKIQTKLGGARNAGRIQVVGGGEWDFKRVGDTNTDMQWLEGMSETARRICAAWNVPHILIVAGESTYNNRENARVEFWVHNVLPYVDKLLGDLNPWLARMYGDEDLELRYDRQAIAALEPVRRATREQARADFQAQLITKNEARLEIDYGEVDGGDEFAPVLANIPNQANAQQNFDLQQEGLDRADAREANKRPQVEKDAETAHQRALELEDRRAKNRQGTKDGGGPARKAEDPFSATDEPPAEPFYAYLEVQAPRRLTRWMRSVGIPKPVAAGKLHLTTVYSAIPPKGYEPSARTETLDPARYRLERLGPDGAVLALVVDSDLAWDRMQAAMAAGAVPAWPTLIPHITLSYDAGEFQIPDHPPDFPITVGPEVIGSSRKGNYPKISDGWGIEARADEPDFSDIPDSLNDDILADTARPSLLGIVRDFGQRTIQRISVTLGFDVRSPAVEGFLARWGGERIRDLVGTTTRRELGEALARVTAEGPTFPKLVAAVQATFDRADKVRAEVIARTETTRAAGFGSQEGMVQGNVERKCWLATKDQFTRDSHAEMDGQIVPVDQDFKSPSGAHGPHPGDLGTSAAENVNCRCVSIAIPDEASAARLATKDARTVEWSEQDNLLLHHERILVAALREGFGRQKRGILQALARSFAMTLRAKAYNPSQPRSPAGTPTGGQWVAHGGLAGGAWRGALTPDEKASVTAYSGGEYRLVNRAARGEKLPEPHRTTAETITGHLAAALEKAALEEPATVWRGALFDDISAFKKGAEFRDAAFLSTSASRGVAEEFMSINSSRKKVLFELKLHAGAKAAELGDLAKKPGEREILVQRGANFRIVGAPKKLNKNAIHVTLEIIENGKRAPMTDRKKAQNQADEQQEPRVDELRGGKYLWGDGDLELTKPGEEDPQDDDED